MIATLRAILAGADGTDAFLTLAGVLAIAWHIRRLRLSFASRTWPTVPGRVQHVELREGTGRSIGQEYAWITYTYKFGARKLTGWRIRFGGWGRDNQSAAEDYHIYRGQRDITVYVNPENPEQSVLEPGPVASLWLGLVPSAGLIVFACWRILIHIH